MGLWKMVRKAILKFLIPPKTTALVVREDYIPTVVKSAALTKSGVDMVAVALQQRKSPLTSETTEVVVKGEFDVGKGMEGCLNFNTDAVDYIVKHSGEQIRIGRYGDIVSGVRVICDDTVEVASHSSGDLFIKKKRFEMGTNRLLAERVEYLNRSQIKGLIRNGCFEPILSFF